MAAPRDGLGKLRSSAGVLQALAQGRTRAGDTAAIYARALLKRADITEEYHVQQEISKNPWTRTSEDPTGRIELAIPLDGDTHFTREAWADVAQAVATRSLPDGSAVIGHLLLRNYAKTSLRDSLQLTDRLGSVPIEVPIGSENPDHLDHLTADRQTCVATYDFDPGNPAVLPAALDINLYDPDSLDLPALDLRTANGQSHIADVIKKIRQQVSFRDELALAITVRLTVPAKPEAPQIHPKVARMAIDWPTITSLRTLRLRRGDRLGTPGADVRFSGAPVRYSPVRGRIEWEDIPMVPLPGRRGDDNMRYYQSVPMVLSIEHPGELYKQDVLGALAEVEIPGYLLSGLAARVYDATGHYRDAPLTTTTKVHAVAELKLDDAFARREFSPNQHLFFDEIIPDEMRITDIRTALRDRGFETSKVWPPDKSGQAPQHYDDGSNVSTWLLVAHRREGPDDMVLWIFVEGRRFDTERETVMHGGGITHKTKLESGELRVFIRGTLARDSKELTREMNALQRTLRERYDRVRQRR